MLPEVPLWLRAGSVGLVLLASFWLGQADAVRTVIGPSIGSLSAGVVAVSVIRGLGLPLGLWRPEAARARPVVGAVLLPAVVFAACVLAAPPPVASGLEAAVDPGTYVLAMGGVVGWGWTLACVRPRALGPWLAAAFGLAVLPYALAGVAAQPPGDGLCWLRVSASGARCEVAILRAFVFLLPIATAGSLVTVEVAFRRLLLGGAQRPGALMVIGAALATAAWAGLALERVPVWGAGWWVVAVTALSAGALYGLSGLLPVSALYTGSVFAAQAAFGTALPITGRPPAVEWGGLVMWLHLGVGAALVAWTIRQQGLLPGAR